jgi:hypothetical protein
VVKRAVYTVHHKARPFLHATGPHAFLVSWSYLASQALGFARNLATNKAQVVGAADAANDLVVNFVMEMFYIQPFLTPSDIQRLSENSQP